MEEFLRYVVGQLIESPNELVLTHTQVQRKITYTLKLRPSDVGKVIGKHGRTVEAIRNLLSASAARTGQKALLQVED